MFEYWRVSCLPSILQLVFLILFPGYTRFSHLLSALVQRVPPHQVWNRPNRRWEAREGKNPFPMFLPMLNSLPQTMVNIREKMVIRMVPGQGFCCSSLAVLCWCWISVPCLWCFFLGIFGVCLTFLFIAYLSCFFSAFFFLLLHLCCFFSGCFFHNFCSKVSSYSGFIFCYHFFFSFFFLLLCFILCFLVFFLLGCCFIIWFIGCKYAVFWCWFSFFPPFSFIARRVLGQGCWVVRLLGFLLVFNPCSLLLMFFLWGFVGVGCLLLLCYGFVSVCHSCLGPFYQVLI